MKEKHEFAPEGFGYLGKKYTKKGLEAVGKEIKKLKEKDQDKGEDVVDKKAGGGEKKK